MSPPARGTHILHASSPMRNVSYAPMRNVVVLGAKEYESPGPGDSYSLRLLPYAKCNSHPYAKCMFFCS